MQNRFVVLSQTKPLKIENNLRIKKARQFTRKYLIEIRRVFFISAFPPSY